MKLDQKTLEMIMYCVYITVAILIFSFDYRRFGDPLREFNALVNSVIDDARVLMKDRDSSHGLDHVLRVYKIAKKIRWCGGDKIDKLIMQIALLHDVYDHKYPNSANNKMFVSEFYGKNVVDAIDHISYSSEVKFHIKDPNISISLSRMRWLGNLDSDTLLARNVVSDADKLDAIGKNGIIRCIDYIKHSKPEIVHDDEQIRILLKAHYDEKLKLLSQYYIVTEKGQKIATMKHKQMEDYMKDYMKDRAALTETNAITNDANPARNIESD
jgi:HD superfamily phosphodiesterase